MVVVLTSIAYFNNTYIEECINDAYEVINKRKGKMVNGSFVKKRIMKIVLKQPNWKHITFKTPKISFLDWAKEGVKVVIGNEEYQFNSSTELEALRLSIQPSYKGNDTCFITTDELKSIYHKTQERMKKYSY